MDSPFETFDLFFGDGHHNLRRSEDLENLGPVFETASQHLDFYPLAYYTADSEAFQGTAHLSETNERTGLVVEDWKTQERLEREWRLLQEATRKYHQPGSFVTFPGYEWQGNGTSGDHNVYYKSEGPPIHRVDTLAELYDRVRGTDAVVIPHHTAYRTGWRGKDWSCLDEALSPFSEVFSLHGCSETDEEWVGLRHNAHMGPGLGDGSYEEALRRGIHLGAVCSGDNWSLLAGCHGNGLMACWAPKLERDAIWNAFKARRVYGVTGDRIQVMFSVNGTPMGGRIASSVPRKIRVRVKGCDALDRIELLRSGRVIATHCHQGTWKLPPWDSPCKFKIRVEYGWGPLCRDFEQPARDWLGLIEVKDGRILNAEPAWQTLGQEIPVIASNKATWRGKTEQEAVTRRAQNAFLFEIEAPLGAPVRVELNGQRKEATVREFMLKSDLLWFKEEAEALLKQKLGWARKSLPREDPVYFSAYRVKIHRAIPEKGYSFLWEVEDDEPFEKEIHYRVRVEQRNGHRAWTSPVWVRPG